MRNLSLILLLILGAAAAGVAAVMLSRGPDDADGVDPVRSTGVHENGTPGPSGPVEAPDLLAREDATPAGLASLEVRVVDPRGGPLNDAVIQIESAAGAQEGRGLERFERLPPGQCTLSVTHPSYPTWRRTLDLAADQRAREVVQLSEMLELRGRVTDRFGSARVGERVWFLRDGERHPSTASAAGTLLSSLSDRDGRLRVKLPEVGRWRVTVGPVGIPTLESEPRELVHGGANTLDIVLPGASLLEVNCRGERGAEALTLMVLERPGDSDRSRPDPQDDGGQGRTGLYVGEPKTNAELAQWSEALRTRQEAQGAEWVNRTSRRVPNDGVLRFTDLPAHREFRLSIMRSGEQHETDSIVTLSPDESVVVELDLPAAQPGGSPVAMILPIRWRTERLAPDLRPAGIDWRQ